MPSETACPRGGDNGTRHTPDRRGSQGDASTQAPSDLRLRHRDLPKLPQDPRRRAARGIRGDSSLRLSSLLSSRPRCPDSHAPDTLGPALPPLLGRPAGGLDALPRRHRRRGGRGKRPGGGRAPAVVRAGEHLPHLAPGCARWRGLRAVGENGVAWGGAARRRARGRRGTGRSLPRHGRADTRLHALSGSPPSQPRHKPPWLGRTCENSSSTSFVNKDLEEGPGHSSPCPKEIVLASSRRLSRHSLPGHLHALLSRHSRKYLYLEHLVPVHPYLAEGVHAIRFHDGDDPWGLRLKPVLA